MKKILIADDEKNLRWILGKNLREQGFLVIEAEDGETAYNLFIDEDPDLVILDYKMPKVNGMEILKRIKTINGDTAVIMITAHGSTDSAIEAMKLGALDYISKPFDIDELNIIISKALNIDNLKKEISYLKTEIVQSTDKQLIGNSKSMNEVYTIVDKVAGTNATILITGESGTGKELIANSIHKKSVRAEKPLVHINCGAIPETLLESELFGYEKGAFTGALTRKPGRFDRAEGGTLFLDEIGELPLALQVKILRVLQEREFERVGGTEVIKADVRILAATNRDLDKMAAEGKFREDLLYRLKVIPIQLPPLRDRKEDIPLLVDFFKDKYKKQLNKSEISIEDEVMDILANYDYPGNIRELENIIERLVILSNEGQINAMMLPKEVLKGAYSSKKDIFILPPEGISLEEVEKSLVRQSLELSKGNQTIAAKLLGISRYALINRMIKFDLKNE